MPMDNNDKLQRQKELDELLKELDELLNKASLCYYSGKVAGSVSNKTDYLINNDIESTSGKNKTAKELGVSIISEDDYIKMLPKN